jgi:hypothetical protein
LFNSVNHSQTVRLNPQWTHTCAYIRMQTTAQLVLILFITTNAPAGDTPVPSPSSPPALAFARYIASFQELDPFTESGPVRVLIEASLPERHEDARLLVIRETNQNERSEYALVEAGGDEVVANEVIARYLALEERIETLPVSSIAITPANYSFHLRGEVMTGSDKAYIYDIKPRKNGPDLIKGGLWINAETGSEVLVSGRLVDRASPGGVDLVRETKLGDGGPFVRITHLAFALPTLGRAELVITEYSAARQPVPAPRYFLRTLAAVRQ